MFGYVTPCVMELKVKDYYKFKSYYCGLCKSIKKNFGNIPRLSLNYDMAFLALLMDSLSDYENTFNNCICMVHPFKKRTILQDNPAIDYAAFCNVTLVYYKLLDDFNDDENIKSKILSKLLKCYFKKIPDTFSSNMTFIEQKLAELSALENNSSNINLDEFTQPFSELTGFLISDHFKEKNFKEDLYWFGYNLGKWIYLIDAFDDLESDMCKSRFNPINKCLNKECMDFKTLSAETKNRIEFSLIRCANECLLCLDKLPINKNKDLLNNVLKYGLMEKIDKVFKRSELQNE